MKTAESTIRQRCELYLKAQKSEDYQSLYHLLFLEENQRHVSEDNDLFRLQSMCYIWKMEQAGVNQKEQDGIIYNIWTGVASVQEAVCKYQKIKFVLRRIEQAMPKDVCVQGLRELLDAHITVPALLYTIKKEVRRSFETMLMTAAYLGLCGACGMRDELLKWGAELEFENYEREPLLISDAGMEKGNTKKQGKFSFIVCTNDEMYLGECFRYIDGLYVPDGCEVETLAIWEANSMAEGYNEGMQASDAEYKIFLHQDVFIKNRWFLYHLLAIYEADESIGLVGVVGSRVLPNDATMWHGERYGEIYSAAEVDTRHIMNRLCPVEGLYQEVEALDGMILCASKDVPFRQDLFDGWDFYDISACMEFRRSGFRVVVAGQKEAWCIHDCGKADLTSYETYRRRFLKEYAGEMICAKNER